MREMYMSRKTVVFRIPETKKQEISSFMTNHQIKIRGLVDITVTIMFSLPQDVRYDITNIVEDKKTVLEKEIKRLQEFAAVRAGEQIRTLSIFKDVLKGDSFDVKVVKGDKTSVQLEQEQYDMLSRIAEKNAGSVGSVISTVLELLFDVRGIVGLPVAKFLDLQMRSLRIALIDPKSFSRERDMERMSLLERINDIFRPDDYEAQISRTIECKDGVITFPREWIVVNEKDAPKYRYAGVIEGSAMNSMIPHFLFFTEYSDAGMYTDKLKEKILKTCIEKCPDFKKVVDKEHEREEGIVKYDGLSDYLFDRNYYMKPEYDFFTIRCDDDPGFGGPENQPYGCYIHRTAD